MSQIAGSPGRIDSRVLIIEDDLQLLELIEDYLQQELNCEIHCAVDREEAEALLDCYKYSLVITDLSLTPKRFEGFDLVEEVADAHGRPRIVVMSGRGADRLKSIALGMGADAYFAKPFPLPELVDTLRELTNSKTAVPAKPPSTGRLLQRVLGKDGIIPLVQPIFRMDGKTHNLMGAECLTRGPAGTPFHRAVALFAYARRKRAEHIVDQHCISIALKAASVIPEPIRISLNVHASTLGRSANFCGWLCSTAAEYSLDPQRLTIEIIEHAPVWNRSEFVRTLADLREAGMRIALDDIGIGHSNFQMMVDAKPDYFKLDRYFVHGCHCNKYRYAVVASVAKLAEEFGSTVIAEGVEDPADLEVLQEFGITLVQGFLFCCPVPVDRFLEWQESGTFCASSL